MPGEISEEELKKMSPEEIAELQKQNCIFCKIASKEIPAKIIHEDDEIICILDINPASEGHILVYPKQHYMILPHVPEETLSKLFKNVKLMSHTLLKAMQCKGTTIFIANGSAAGQRAPHVLVHVFPRRENDGLVELPKYEEKNGETEKLKRTLEPYINQILGKGKQIDDEHKESKDKEGAAAETTKKTNAREESLQNSQEDDDKNKIEMIGKLSSDKKGIQATKEAKTKPPKKQTQNNISLDDISHLFE